MFELVADIKIILQCAFAAACDEGHVFHAGLQRFVHAVVNERLGQDRQHLFW